MIFSARMRSWLVVLLIAGAVRIATVVIGWDSLRSDPDSYGRLAVNLAASGVFGFEDRAAGMVSMESVRATAYRPPFYPWLLSWLVVDGELERWAVAIMHVVLGVATAMLTYSIARRLGCVGWMAALAVALDPLLLRQSQLVMTETLAAFLVVAAWRIWIVLRPQANSETKQRSQNAISAAMRGAMALALGIVFGLGILTRPPLAVWTLLCGLGLLFTGRASIASTDGQPRIWIERIWGTGWMTLGVALCVLPWMARNQRLLGKPIWATTHGGYTLLLANNPIIYEHFREHGPSRAWNAEPFHQAWARRTTSALSPTEPEFWQLGSTVGGSPESAVIHPIDERKDNVLAYDSARATIAREPATFLLSSLYRLSWLWALWPYQNPFTMSALLIGAWYAFWYSVVSFQLVLHVAACFPAEDASDHSEASLQRRFIRGVSKLLSASWLPGLALAISLTTIHAVYWSNMRMRAPLMCVVYMAAVPRRRIANH